MQLRGGGGCWGHFPCRRPPAGSAAAGACAVCGSGEAPTPHHVLRRCVGLRAEHARRDAVVRAAAGDAGLAGLEGWLAAEPPGLAQAAAQCGVVSAIPGIADVRRAQQHRLAVRLAAATADVALRYVDAAAVCGGAGPYEPRGGRWA